MKRYDDFTLPCDYISFDKGDEEYIVDILEDNSCKVLFLGLDMEEDFFDKMMEENDTLEHLKDFRFKEVVELEFIRGDIRKYREYRLRQDHPYYDENDYV